VLALINETRWDASAKALRTDVQYEIGRRMTTSASNRVSASVTVTPNCVLQVETSLGLVAETKASLPLDVSSWDDDIIQLLKYDDDLLGWWTKDERIAGHDIVALVPLPRAVRFADRLEAGVASRKWSFQRKVSVVGFYKASGVKDFMALKKERGELSQKDLDERLRESRQISLSLLIAHYHDRKFVDHEPPLPYLLQIIWDYLFTRYAAEVPKTEGERPESLALTITAEKVTHDLQEYFGFKSEGSRSPEIPRVRWVRKALDSLVEFKMADKADNGEYTIKYKRTRSDTLKKFGQLCYQLEQRKARSAPDSRQFSLM
jgi:hypothetical protein